MEGKAMSNDLFAQGITLASKAARSRTVIFHDIGIALEIGREEIGDDLADKITGALDKLTEMTEHGLPLVSNHTAMEYLAEMMTLVNAQDEAMRKLTQIPVEVRHEFIKEGNPIRTAIRILAKM
jgi:hypothetical protein